MGEGDFDRVFQSAGAQRISGPTSAPRDQLLADHMFGESVVELKLVSEEGLEKTERQKKLAVLFKNSQPDRPVVVLSPELLSEAERLDYYRIMETPVKTHIAKAAKQLKGSRQRHPRTLTTVMLLVNTGYTSLGMGEFEEIARRRIVADTTQIDYLITAGVYFYGDGFDYYTFFPFRLFPINVTKPFHSFAALEKAWNDYTEQIMTNIVTGADIDGYKRSIVVDLSFKVEDIVYVKPSPPIGKASAFYRKGRPRANSTGVMTSPPVGLVFPKLNGVNWRQARKAMPDCPEFGDSYADYVRRQSEEEGRLNTELRPFVPFTVEYEAFVAWAREEDNVESYENLCAYAVRLFTEAVKAIADNAINIERSRVIPSRYVYLVVEEIGQDKAFDMSSAYLLQEEINSTHKEVLFQNLKMFFEYGLVLAAAYAAKYSVERVVYKKETRFKWE